MKGSRVEYYCLKLSIAQFHQDLQKIGKIIENKTFSDEESLEIIHDLVGIKETIESLEDLYWKVN
jgi:hypothetical protein